MHVHSVNNFIYCNFVVVNPNESTFFCQSFFSNSGTKIIGLKQIFAGQFKQPSPKSVMCRHTGRGGGLKN